MNLIRRLPRRAAALGALFLAVCLAPPAAADLIFIDDFEDPVVTSSSPAPGLPGGGSIGGAGFWTPYRDAAPQGSNTVENGFLTMTIGNATAANQITRLQSQPHAPFDPMRTALLQGLQLSVRGFSMDWTDGYGSFQSGFYTGGTIWSSSNSFTFHVSATSGVVTLYGKQNAPSAAPAVLQTLVPSGAERPTGFDLYIDPLYYTLEAFYDDNSSVQVAGFHGFDDEIQHNHLLLMLLTVAQTHPDTYSVVRLGEITVTQIPEPGALGLALAALGAALAGRRIRKR